MAVPPGYDFREALYFIGGWKLAGAPLIRYIYMAQRGDVKKLVVRPTRGSIFMISNFFFKNLRKVTCNKDACEPFVSIVLRAAHEKKLHATFYA